jgi:hypothetical protein
VDVFSAGDAENLAVFSDRHDHRGMWSGNQAHTVSKNFFMKAVMASFWKVS